MTTGPMDGGFVFVSMGGTLIECLTDCTLNKSAEEIDITCKNTGGNKDKKRGAKEWSVDFSMNYKEDGTGAKFTDLDNAYEAGTEVTIRYGSTEPGDTYWEGLALINTLSISAGNTGSLVTASGTFSGKGTLTKGVNP